MKRALLLAALLLGCGSAPSVRPPAPVAEPSALAPSLAPAPAAAAPSRSWIGAARGLSIRSIAVSAEGRLFVAGDHRGLRVGQREVRSAGGLDAVVLAWSADGTPSWVWRYGEFGDDSVAEVAIVGDALAVSLDSIGATDLGGTVQVGDRLVGLLELDDARERGFTAFGADSGWAMEEPGPRLAARDGSLFAWVSGAGLTLRGEPLAARGPIAVRLDERGDPAAQAEAADAGATPDAGTVLAGVDQQGVAWGIAAEEDTLYLGPLDPALAGTVGPRVAVSGDVVWVRRANGDRVVAALGETEDEESLLPDRLVAWSSDGERVWERGLPFAVSAGDYDPASNTLVVGGLYTGAAEELEGLDISRTPPGVIVAAFDASDGATRWVRTYRAAALKDVVIAPAALVLALGLGREGRLGAQSFGGDALVWLEGGLLDGEVEPGRRVDLAEGDAPIRGLDGLEEAWTLRPPDAEEEERRAREAWEAGAPTEREADVLARVVEDASRRHFATVSPIGHALLASPQGERAVVLYAYQSFESWRGRLQRTGRWNGVLSRGQRAAQRCSGNRERERERIERAIGETDDAEELARLEAEEAALEMAWQDLNFVEGPCDPMIHVYDGYLRARRCGHDRFVVATYAVGGSSDAPQLGRRLGATERELCSYVRDPVRLQSHGPGWGQHRPERFTVADIDGDARPEVLVGAHLAFEEVQSSGRLGLAGFPSERTLLSVAANGTVEELWSTGVDPHLDQSEDAFHGTPSRTTHAWLEDVDGDERLELVEEVVTFRSRCACDAMHAHATYGTVNASRGPEAAPWRLSSDYCGASLSRDAPTRTCRVLGPPVRTVHEL